MIGDIFGFDISGFNISGFLVISFVITGVAAGFIAGLFGVGGGVIMVPIFYVFFHTEELYGNSAIQAAVATSLAVMIITSLSSAQFHYRRGAVDRQLVAYWAIPIVIGSIAGSWLAARTPAQELTIFFGAFMILIGLKMTLNKKVLTVSWGDQTAKFFNTNPVFRYLPPVIVGCISSMLGVGGGSMTVPILSAFGYPMVRAVGTSATFGFFIAIPAVIIFSTNNGNIPSNINSLHVGFIDLAGFLIVGPISVLMAPVGAKVAHSLKGNVLKRIFGFLLLFIGIRMIFAAIF